MTIVKICGITNLEDALAAIDAGADLLGFAFYPKSPRYVTVEQAQEIVKGIQDRRPETGDSNPGLRSPVSSLTRLVGLFVNETSSNIAQILQQTQLDYAQLHGDETPALLAQVGQQAFRAIRPTSLDDALDQAQQFHHTQIHFQSKDNITHHVPHLLLDAYDSHAYGGTGKKADWQAAAAVMRRYPNVLLAGGLTPENVGAAIRIVQPWGVDVSSGVETSPGKKDHVKIKEFIRAAKQATSA